MCDSVEFRQKTDECAERPLTYCLLETSLCASCGWLMTKPKGLFFQNSADYVAPWPGLALGGTFERALAVQSSFMLPPCLVPSHDALSSGANTLGKRPRVWVVLQRCRSSFLPFRSCCAAQWRETGVRDSGRADPGHEGVEAAGIRRLQGVHHGEIA